MPVPKFFKTEFDALATDNAIGHPNGEPAYGYLRVSSAGQADEGRSGLPRQIMNVHEAAVKYGLKIPWEYLFADDHSGFEFTDRPDLSRLRKEYKSSRRRANAVVVEHLDRLSRNADWHQGYLLDEMRQYGLQPVFWKEFTSRIERAVMGAIAQDGMEQAKQRMAEGNIHKARSGRVTARTPAYGYKLVDSTGREGERARKDTHYAIREEEAQVVRLIYQLMGQGSSLRGISELLNQKGYPAPKRSRYWNHRSVVFILKNPVYKGEYMAHTWKQVKVPVHTNTASLTGSAVRTVTRRVPRPPEEWIMVPVPAIVSGQEWEMANRILEKNARMSQRNAKDQYLLTGLIECACCGRSYVGRRRIRHGRSGQEWKTAWYFCSSRVESYSNATREEIGCTQGNISNRILESGVWSVVYQVLLQPEILLDVLEREFHGERNEQIASQVAFLEGQLEASRVEDEKLYKAYVAGVFNEVEYAGRRKMIKDNQHRLAAELHQLGDSLISPERFEQQKQEILMICQHAAASGLAKDAPFEIRRNIIKAIVEKIVLNVDGNWFELHGIIHGRYALYEDADSRPTSRRRNGRRSSGK